MKRMFSLVVLFFFPSAAFAVETCDDMSHVRVRPGAAGEFVYTQKGCEGWSSVQIVDGAPVSEPQFVKFSGEPVIVKVDDEYETYEAQHEWSWNAPENGHGIVLHHALFYQGFNKKTGVRKVRLLSETFSRMGEHVHHFGGDVNIETAADGTKTEKTISIDEFFSRK